MTNHRVLVLSLIFPPDGVSSAQLLGEIAEDLSVGKMEVEVVTTQPHYNVDESARNAQPIEWDWHRLTGRSVFKGIPVVHLRMPQKSGGSAGRIAQWLWFHVGSLLIIAKRRGKYDSILTISPPPTVAIVGGLAAKLTKARLVFCVWELYPEILVAMDVVKRGSGLHHALRLIERLTYQLADVIAVLQDPMAAGIAKEFPKYAHKLKTVPTFADVDFLKPVNRETKLRLETGFLTEQILFGYAGNLGASEDLKPVLEVASELGAHGFLICGDGTDRESLESNSAGQQNVHFTGQLPYERVPEIIGSCDVALVVLSPGVGHEALPSKVYRTMACGRPILAICDAGTPLAELVQAEEIGLVADPTDIGAIFDAATELAENENMRKEMALRARSLAVERFSRSAVTETYRSLLTGVNA